MTITDNERAFLTAVASNEYQDCHSQVDNPVWTDCVNGWERASKGGTVASLVKKGLLGQDDECVWLTQEGFDAIEAGLRKP